MIGDKIIVTKKDIRRAKVVLPNVLKLKNKAVITIQGGSGCKKTELGKCLQEQLYLKSKKSLLISLDDNYISHFNERARLRKRKGVSSVGLKEIDWTEIKGVVSKFKKNCQELNTQIINKYTNSYNELIIYHVKSIDYLIIEGLFAGYLKKYNLVDYCIHLQGSPKQTYSFRQRRAKENEDNKFRQKVVEKEYKVVTQLKKYADIILPFD